MRVRLERPSFSKLSVARGLEEHVALEGGSSDGVAGAVLVGDGENVALVEEGEEGVFVDHEENVGVVIVGVAGAGDALVGVGVLRGGAEDEDGGDG